MGGIQVSRDGIGGCVIGGLYVEREMCRDRYGALYKHKDLLIRIVPSEHAVFSVSVDTCGYQTLNRAHTDVRRDARKGRKILRDLGCGLASTPTPADKLLRMVAVRTRYVKTTWKLLKPGPSALFIRMLFCSRGFLSSIYPPTPIHIAPRHSTPSTRAARRTIARSPPLPPRSWPARRASRQSGVPPRAGGAR